MSAARQRRRGRPAPDTALEVKLIDWDAPSPTGLRPASWAAPAASRSARPIPRSPRSATSSTACTSPPRSAWRRGRRRSSSPGSILPVRRPRLPRRLPAAADQGWGTLAQTMDPPYATRKFVSWPRGSSTVLRPAACSRRRSSAPRSRSLRPARRPGRGPRPTSTAPDAARGARSAAVPAWRSRAAAAATRRARPAGIGGEPPAATTPSARGDRAAARPTAPARRPRLAAGAIGVVDLANRAAVAPRKMDVNGEQTLDGLRWSGWGSPQHDRPRHGVGR